MDESWLHPKKCLISDVGGKTSRGRLPTFELRSVLVWSKEVLAHSKEAQQASDLADTSWRICKIKPSQKDWQRYNSQLDWYYDNILVVIEKVLFEYLWFIRICALTCVSHTLHDIPCLVVQCFAHQRFRSRGLVGLGFCSEKRPLRVGGVNVSMVVLFWKHLLFEEMISLTYIYVYYMYTYKNIHIIWYL